MRAILMLALCSSLYSSWRRTFVLADCPENERLVKNVNPCNTCWEKGDCSSPSSGPGCDCLPGYYRDGEDFCVPESECDEDDTSTSSELSVRTWSSHPAKMCRKDEEYLSCGCHKTCCNRGRPDVQEDCAPNCTAGCFCKGGLVRDEDGSCVRLEDCGGKGKCGAHEVYKKCGTACPETCSNRGKPRVCTYQCVKGCFCEEGYVRHDDGKCVKPTECPHELCGINEEYTDCGTACPATCSNRNKAPDSCTEQCIKGCFCKKGYIRNDDGECVKPEQCPHEECGQNEVHETCGSVCPETCENWNKTIICTLQCVVGCFCKKGYVRNRQGKCIPPDQCPPREKCQPDEEYYDYMPNCKNTCGNHDKPGVRCARGPPGCFCKKGLVKREDGKCVKPSECKKCTGYNEVLVDCAKPKWCNTCDIKGNCKLKECKEGCDCKPGHYRNASEICIPESKCPGNECTGYNEVLVFCAKPKWCNTCDIKGNCKLTECKEGCDCKPGHYRNASEICIPESKCPGNDQCGMKEEYKECGTACPKTCANRHIKIRCVDKCVEGCFCKEDLVRNDLGQCVDPSECPDDECGKNEEYSTCGSSCPETCDNYGKPVICSHLCRVGCFCKEGYVRNKEGECVPPSQCPKSQCGPKEEYKACGTACPKTCANRHIKIKCVAKCVEGCFCKDGFVRDDSGKCVEPSECPKDECRKNEEYSTCGSSCPETCDNYGKPVVCTQQCKVGCFCKDGYVRNKDGECVLPSQCPKEQCGKNEEYSTCGSACVKTCANRNRNIFCTQQCVTGCFCKEGYVRNKNGECILPRQCPIDECYYDEEYKECGSSCPPKCSTLNKPRHCTKQCVKGCFCKGGLVRNEDGDCVDPSRCPNQECKDNEEYRECGSACPATCSNKSTDHLCTDECVKGCFCKAGYVKNDDGECVEPKECTEKCPGKNEVVVDCAKPKNCNTCIIKGNCFLKRCIRGCDCKPGYYRDEDGICIPEDQCPGQCPVNEVYSTCANPCNDCEIRGKCNFLVCNKGCDCIKGYHRYVDGKCIPAAHCPIKEECGENEEYTECGTACPVTCSNRDSPPEACPTICIKGCFCSKGYIKNDDGECVRPEECPEVPSNSTCGEDEELYECSPYCERSCEAYAEKGKVACTRICRKGCFCKEGLYKRKDGQCVPPEKCSDSHSRGVRCSMPKCDVGCKIKYNGKPCPRCVCSGDDDPPPVECFPSKCDGPGCSFDYSTEPCPTCVCIATAPPVVCGEDEEYYPECAPSCGGTCETYGKTIFCPLCRPGCWCKKGLVKGKDGKCILPSECKKDPPPVECLPSKCDGPGCSFDYSTEPCPTCVCIATDMPPVQCSPPKCDDSGCSIDYSTEPCPSCVCETSVPPVVCEEDEEYYPDCAPSCGGTCETYGKTIHCPLCRPGCWCKKGLVKRKDGKCISPSECKKDPPTTSCGEDEELYNCVPTCNNTCENHGKKQACPMYCRSGCFCKKGLVKRSDGKCVDPSDCVTSKSE